MSTEKVKQITVKKLPLILNKNIILKKGNKSFNSKIKLLNTLRNSVQEDVIYTSVSGDFTSGEAQSMTIVNQLNILTKASRTIAKCQSYSGEIYEKTSDEIIKLIGQNSYNLLFSSLCSLLSQEFKIRSINALLTVPKSSSTVSCQTEAVDAQLSVKKELTDTSCQTTETCIEELKKFKVKRRNKRPQLAPYVVKDDTELKKPRRIIINPNNFEKVFIKEESDTQTECQTENSLPELGAVEFDDDSNASVGKISLSSFSTLPDLMLNPMSIITNVEKHTRPISPEVKHSEQMATEQCTVHKLELPIDPLRSNGKLSIETKDLLHNVPREDRIKMLLRQGINDLKFCLVRDSEGHLPIHVAILTNDEDLLRRQCLALKVRDATVDVPADGITPLRMSLFQENTHLTSILLQHGADPLDNDDDDNTPFHVAAEMATDHLQILVNYCQENARKILEDNQGLWKPGFESKSDKELSQLLLTHINQFYNSQGYTPLMLASKLGKYNSVMTLVESSRESVNVKMPNSGNTALYLAVSSACMDAAQRGNKSKIVDHFRKTVEILVENGADPNIVNFAGFSVNDLLTETNIGELSMLIANKLTSVRYFDNTLPKGIKGSDFMLVKDKEGKVNIREVRETKEKKKRTKNSPVILENIPYKPQNKLNASVSISPGQLANQPGVSGIKQENVNVSQSNTPIIKNFKLNKPVIIKSEVTNNKRKLDFVIEPNKNKKPNKESD